MLRLILLCTPHLNLIAYANQSEPANWGEGTPYHSDLGNDEDTATVQSFPSRPAAAQIGPWLGPGLSLLVRLLHGFRPDQLAVKQCRNMQTLAAATASLKGDALDLPHVMVCQDNEFWRLGG